MSATTPLRGPARSRTRPPPPRSAAAGSRRTRIVCGLSLAATAIGLVFLASILATLFVQGLRRR